MAGHAGVQNWFERTQQTASFEHMHLVVRRAPLLFPRRPHHSSTQRCAPKNSMTILNAKLSHDSDSHLQQSAPPRGALLVFEGVDRCGKSSQTKDLVASLGKAGVKAELWCYPDRTTAIGGMLNAYLSNKAELSDHAVHLLFAANRWEKR